MLSVSPKPTSLAFSISLFVRFLSPAVVNISRILEAVVSNLNPKLALVAFSLLWGRRTPRLATAVRSQELSAPSASAPGAAESFGSLFFQTDASTSRKLVAVAVQ